MDTRTSPHRLRIDALRETMARLGVDGVLVPSADPHLSEYLPERWQARQWLSGFTGSMGTLAITLEQAAVFADSRYWEQAERELAGSGIVLVKIGAGSTPAHLEWLAAQVRRGGTVAADGQVLGLASAQALRTALDRAGIALRTDLDVVDAVWPDRPGLPTASVYEHRPPHATAPRADKLRQVREAMAHHGAGHHLVSSVDDIAWITNLRGSDVAYNPVFLAHLLIEKAPLDGADAAGRATLFIADGKIDRSLSEQLAADGIHLAPYTQATHALAALPADATILLDPKRVTLGLRQHIPSAVKVVEAINPSTLLKSRKTAAEAAHIREAMIEDGVAMCIFYAWFEDALARWRAGEAGAAPLSELTVAERLSAERAKRPGFVGLSFPVIAGFAANGALPHYRATDEAFSMLEGDSLLLIDSGGQYLGGTTDITRVWPIGNPTPAMKRDYTLVLKGTMGLSRARFPRGTPGPMLDAIARAPLWAEGLDFGHGTGHGVGYFLNVHEGPQTISKATPDPHMAMEPGMITSVEPGVYRSGLWGVRIENLVMNVPASTPEGDSFAGMLEFETLTLCPIDTRCIDRRLLRDDEVAWLNAYHATVRERLAPRVEGAAKAWLLARTEALT